MTRTNISSETVFEPKVGYSRAVVFNYEVFI